jgi:type I restriction enzyme S subunit
MASRGDIDYDTVQPSLYSRWKIIDFQKSLDETPKYIKHKTKGLSKSGTYPVIDQGDSFIGGYINDANKIYTGKLPVIVFGDHTRVVKFIDFEFAVGADGTKILRPNSQLNPKFFYYYLKTLKVPDLGYSRHFKMLKEIKVPLAPRDEQDRIVVKLDSLFEQLESINKSLYNVPTLLKNFRKQVLTQAVTGKLTEEWREDKDFPDFKIMGIKNSNFKLHSVPKQWLQTSIDQIGKVKGGKRLPKGHALLNEDTGLPYIRARDLKEGTVLTDNLMYLLPETQKSISRYVVQTGDLYITIVGAKIGDAGIIPEKMDGANLTENAAKICELKPEVFSQFVSIWLQSNICFNNMMDSIKSAAQGKLALTRIKLLPIYLPPFKEQQEIVKCLESLFAKADAIEEHYKALKTKIEHLPQAILHKAFKGELLQQRESDGNARELLKEIEGLKKGIISKVKSGNKKK